ncbi:MarR family transcriptional regulator [Chitinophaga polysaccharea]|uniref:MarR family winged helix-turn-helix transcriptional regulator n=1 Tax=Chitinophaga TaxID=79328 RepID=UPI001455B7B7|nr:MULTISPECIES: MarR family transcriptional regulator [Chitinophaga]NLR61003.1 MarR family transcriptional regulator [Chitinophaga polysaccharea]NLU96212.1 MarR family transcriptional regulator [Chitinophaga sp. Ak27]
MSATIDARYEACLTKRPDNLARLINLFKKDIDQRITERIQERGYKNFKLGDMVLLVHIDPHGTINNDLARKARISKQAMSKVVKNLEAENYISSRKHDTDNRASLIFLTEKGKEFMINVYEAVDEIQAGYEAIIGADAFSDLKTILKKLNAGLNLT